MRLNLSIGRKIFSMAIFLGLLLWRQVSPALAAAPAHDQPPGAEWLMADWMLLSFLAFAGAGFVMFLVVLKRGLLQNLEGAKYYILTLDEPDYYTPDWAKEDGNASSAKR